jgi:hypothetical protein
MHNPSITCFNPLQPVVVRTIREAFDTVVGELELRRGDQAPPLPDSTRAKLARRLVELAKHGERDFERFRAAALNVVHA